MKAKQNSDDSNRASKGKGFWHYLQILGELILVLLFLLSTLLITLTIMQG